MKKIKSNIVNINHINESNSCAIVPGYNNRKKNKKLKQLPKSKGNCFFSSGVSYNLINFIYRAVVHLGLKNKKFIFSRGAVKKNNISVVHAVGVRELDWDVGISIRIPHKLNYNDITRLLIGNEEHELKIMELIILSALLRFSYPNKKIKWYSDMAAIIISKGWHYFESIISSKDYCSK